MRPIKLKINVTRILKEGMYKGQNGVYLECACFPNKSATKDGSTHFIVQDLPKARRDAGEKGPIIGSLTLPEEVAGSARVCGPAPGTSAPSGTTIAEDEIPF